MIDDDTKNKLIKEIEKFGIISVACAKIGIDKATYYRWLKNDPDFRKKANASVRIGRSNAEDLSEYSLIGNVKQGNQRAIEYYLGHRSARYRPKKTNDYNFSYRKVPIEIPREKTLEDELDEMEKKFQEKTEYLLEKFNAMGGIPPKIDGTPIKVEEIVAYEQYIEDYHRPFWKKPEGKQADETWKKVREAIDKTKESDGRA